MKVYDKPYTFINGDVLDPRDLNGVWNYKREALKDAAARRYVESVVPVTFMRTSQDQIDNTDNADMRTYSFTPPADVYVTRAFLVARFGATITADVNIKFQTGAGATPAGCTDPWLSVSAGTDIGDEIRDYNPARFKLEGGTRYEIVLESSAAFTISQLDVSFHVLSDRFGFSSTNEPSFQPIMVSEDLPTNIVSQNNNNANFATEVAKLGVSSYAPVTHCLHDVTSTTANEPWRKFPIPRIDDDRAAATIESICMWVAFDAAQTTTFTIELTDDSGGVITGSIFPVIANTAGYINIAGVNQSLVDSGDGVAADTSEDRFVRFRTSSTVTVNKAFIMVWIK